MQKLLNKLSKYGTFIEAVGLLMALLFFSIAINISNSTLQGIVTSISASFFFLFCVEFIQNQRRLIEQYRFKRFFGNDVTNNKMYLVYPNFKLNNVLLELKKEHNILQDFEKSPSLFNTSHRIDLDKAVAENDLCAMIYLTGLFSEVSRMTPPIMVDSDMVKEPNKSFISFGLTSNDCTHMYLAHSTKPAFQLITNDNRLDDYLAVYNEQEQEFRYTTILNKIYYGIILKYHPDPHDNPDRVWFYCAGLGTKGTTGSAWYIANKWKKLYRMVGVNDFIAVVKVYNNTDIITELELIVKK